MAARQAPPIPQELKQRPHSHSSGGRKAQHQRVEEHLWSESTKPKPISSTGPLETAWEVAPPPGFWEVMACPWRDLLPATDYKAPLEPLQLEVAIEPTVATMCTSHIVQGQGHGDDIYGYHHHLRGASSPQGPQPGNSRTHHRGYHWPPLKDRPMTAFGWKGRLMTTLGGGVGWWLPLGGRIVMPFGRNNHMSFCHYSKCMPWWLFTSACWAGWCFPPFL